MGLLDAFGPQDSVINPGASPLGAYPRPVPSQFAPQQPMPIPGQFPSPSGSTFGSNIQQLLRMLQGNAAAGLAPGGAMTPPTTLWDMLRRMGLGNQPQQPMNM